MTLLSTFRFGPFRCFFSFSPHWRGQYKRRSKTRDNARGKQDKGTKKKKPRIGLSKVLRETFQTTRAQGAAPITVRGGEGVVSGSLSEYSMIFHAYRKLCDRPLRSAFLHCVLAAIEVSPAFQGQFVLPGASYEQFLARSRLNHSPFLGETPSDSDPSDALCDRKDFDDIG